MEMNGPDEIEILRTLLIATQKGKLVWEQSSAGEYLGTGPMTVVIKEVCPLVAGDPETVGVQAFELEVGRMFLYFWSGTPGIYLIQQILAAGLPDWDDHSQDMKALRKRVIEAFETD